MIGLISSDEFHFVVTTRRPSATSHVLNSLRCVVFPEPSGPSNATRRPRRRPASEKCARARCPHVRIEIGDLIISVVADRTQRRNGAGRDVIPESSRAVRARYRLCHWKDRGLMDALWQTTQV